ncbi:MAG: hypothetical protein ABI702_17390 [Burkholderiales bacterium]
MNDFNDSTLWRISSFEQYRLQTGTSAFARLDGPTLLPTTLMADLRRLENAGDEADALEVVAACMRHHEAALVCMQLDGMVWPITLFPSQGTYHSPRDLLAAKGVGLGRMTVLTTEPPGLRPPGDVKQDRIGNLAHYHPLSQFLWALALHGGRSDLLNEISGAAAYRATRRLSEEGIAATGAVSSAAEALLNETVSLRTIAGWPGMSLERAKRLLNGLYLVSALRVTRGGPAARAEPRSWFPFLGGSKPRR